MTRGLVLVPILVAGISCAGPPGQAVHSVPLPSDALVLKVDGAGRLFRNGAPATIDSVVAAMKWDAASICDPIVLDLPPALTVRECSDLLRALIEKARRTNIGFAQAQGGVVLLPVLRATSPEVLSIRTGRSAYDEGSPQRHLWVDVRAARGGRLSFVAVREGFLEPAIHFPEPGGSPPRELTLSRWGDWSFETLGEFLDQPDVVPRAPFVNLIVTGEDRVEDWVACLGRLHAVAPGRIVVSLLN